MMLTVKQILSCAVATAAIVVALAQPAQAATINPDLTINPTTFTWNGTSFGTTCNACFFSWTTPTGGFGGGSVGNLAASWNGTTGSFSLSDTTGGSGLTGLLLGGTFSSFTPSVVGPNALFSGLVHLTTTHLSFGNLATVKFASSDFGIATANSGTASVDVALAAVPEPATLSLLGLGLGAAILATRRLRAHAVLSV